VWEAGITRGNVSAVRCGWLAPSVLGFVVGGLSARHDPSSALSAVCLPHFVPLSSVLWQTHDSGLWQLGRQVAQLAVCNSSGVTLPRDPRTDTR
jgi:hypothetical protein